MGIGDPLLRKERRMTVTNETHLPPLGVQVREEVGGELPGFVRANFCEIIRASKHAD
jgi:hypothetical protein